jgi:S-DNA-T family DNA segregation ATPase FtsK/SpoIIIE
MEKTMKSQFFFMNTLVRYLIGCAIIACAIIFALAIGSYHPHDPSWWFISGRQHGVANYLGLFGSYSAAAWLYLFDICSWLCIALMVYSALLIMQVRSFVAEWDRLFARAVAIITACALLAQIAYKPLFAQGVPGGIVGKKALTLVAMFVDPSLILFVLLAIMATCLLISTRLEIILMPYRIGALVWSFLMQHRIPQTMGSYSWKAIAWSSMRAYATLCWMAAFVTGRLAKRYPELFDYSYESGEPSIEQIARDAFWQYYQKQHTQHSAGPEQRPAAPTYGKQHVDDVSIALAERSATSFADTNVQQDAGAFDQHQRHLEGAVGLGYGDAANCVNEKHSEGVTKRAYALPSLALFTMMHKQEQSKKVQDAARERANLLQEKLRHFGIDGRVESIQYGPVITLFEYRPNIDIKVSKILSLEDDLALALQTTSLRIIAPIPGKALVGFEVANDQRLDVLFSEIVHSDEFAKSSAALPLVLGQDAVGKNVVVDLVKMPHLLVAGSTGSGKSVALNAMLVSLLCNKTPDELKLILIDPKRLEFASYADIGHLVFPIVVQPAEAISVLTWLVKTMEQRYELMAQKGVRNIVEYHKRFGQQGRTELPFIVLVIDELADLFMTAGKQVEDLVVRIAQMARAAGIHAIVATQRPSVDVITGLLKVNFPSRISFRVTSKVDSRTILDMGGAEKLLGRGDMLFMDSGSSFPTRVHGAYVSNKEIESVVQHIRAEGQPLYLDLVDISRQSSGGALLDHDDQLYGEVVQFLNNVDEVSISMIQRKFRIGYNRSARIIEQLEHEGRLVVADGGKTRKVVRMQS